MTIVSINSLVLALIPVMVLLGAALVTIGVEVYSWFKTRPVTLVESRIEKPAYAPERVAV